MRRMSLATYIVSIVGLGLFMSHFWWAASNSPIAEIAAAASWSIAGACAIFCLYAGIIGRAQVEDRVHRAMLTACAVVGGIILLGVTLSAIFLFVPRL